MGYSALNSGLSVSPRGIGAMISMIVAGVLIRRVDGRILIAFGFAILGYSTFLLSHINLGISMTSVALPNLMNGLSGGFIFVPLTTLAMSRLRKSEIGNAAGIYNLMRNIGGSIGIASVTTMLVRGSQAHQNYLAAHVTAGNSVAMGVLQGLQAKFCAAGMDHYSAHQKALGSIYRSLQQQASLLAYADNFRLLGSLALLCIPLAMLLRRAQKHSQERSGVVAE
jgi:DHA2 family multidrug resistance protein